MMLPTLGGRQFWTDHTVRFGYRIQRHVWWGKFRLLDPRDRLLKLGSRDACLVMLDRHAPYRQSQDDQREVVILLHGLGRTRFCMNKLEKKLRAAGHDDVIRVGYASTREPIEQHASALNDIINDFPPSWKIHFVAHSLGNIVIRHWIHDCCQDDSRRGQLSRCQSLTMLGPPNQGSKMARVLRYSLVFPIVMGRSGMQLGAGFEDLRSRLANPTFPFRIIAGDGSGSWIKNPILGPASDLVVALNETKLESPQQSVSLPVIHSVLMTDGRVIDLILKWLPSKDDQRENKAQKREPKQEELRRTNTASRVSFSASNSWRNSLTGALRISWRPVSGNRP